MNKQEYKKSSCYNCKYSGMLDRLGWVKCCLKDVCHILPQYNCKDKIKETNKFNYNYMEEKKNEN